MRLQQTPEWRSWAAYAAAALAFASATISLHWTLGGTFLLDTVGGTMEELARERSPRALAVGTATVIAKIGLGGLGLVLARPRARCARRRPLLTAGWAASALLLVWGGANVLLGALVLVDVIVPSQPVDEHALRYHVFLWDLWFLLWGAALAAARSRYQRERPRPSAG